MTYGILHLPIHKYLWVYHVDCSCNRSKIVEIENNVITHIDFYRSKIFFKCMSIEVFRLLCSCGTT